MNKPSSRDPNQIVQYSHDEEYNAQRVTIVGGDFGLADALKEGLKDLKIEIPTSKQTFEWPMTVEKEVLVKQYETLQIPQIIKEQEIKIVEVPKVIYETKFIEIEKPIIIKEVEIKVIEQQVIVKEIKNLDMLFKVLIVTQILTTLLVLFKTFYH